MLLRKVIVWASGDEIDRPGMPRLPRQWLGRVERFVSLAGINRGWTVDPRPEKMAWYTAAGLRIGERIARWTGTARFMLAFQRGAPFVADLRIQWMRAGRRGAALPLTIHLLGTTDDIVSNEDSRDVCVAEGVKFVTLPDTGHRDIAEMIARKSTSYRAALIREAVAGDPSTLPVDATVTCPQDPAPTRLVFILHGIRDYADWGERLADEIALAARTANVRLAVEPPKYGWFPMAPFLLQPDRQRKVRWFMDQYTDAISRYPNAREIDFIGHSHGTYLLGSALTRYRTITIRNAYLAGSVLPQRFPWEQFVPGRVHAVRNVVASRDWVVGIFPRLLEQVAEWSGVESVTGALDLGAAGFRGFQRLAGGAVRNIKFAEGGHGVGVDVSCVDTRKALVAFAIDGTAAAAEDQLVRAFQKADGPAAWSDWASRLCWILWVLLVLAVGTSIVFAWRTRRWLGIAWLALIIGILNSI
jgi:hypothetical protein